MVTRKNVFLYICNGERAAKAGNWLVADKYLWQAFNWLWCQNVGDKVIDKAVGYLNRISRWITSVRPINAGYRLYQGRDLYNGRLFWSTNRPSVKYNH